MKKALFLGLATLDIQYFVDEFPASNVKVKTRPPDFWVGGPATNAAVAFAKLNGNAHLVTAVGENAFQSVFKSDFEQCNIQHIDLLHQVDSQPVLASVISASNGERTIFTHYPDRITQPIDEKKLLDQVQPEVVMLDGFYPEVAVKLAQEATKRQIPVVFDGGSWKSYLPELLPFVDYAICSNDFYPPVCVHPEEIFDYLDQFAISHKAITRGDQSILVGSGDACCELHVPQVDVIDTLGAGDFFHGAFCFYLLTKDNYLEALQKSAEFASRTCLFKGPRSWLNKLI